MIVTRTPFRITLGGGGTDLPAYYMKYGGFIFAAGIDKYMHISLDKTSDDSLRIRHFASETVRHRDKVKHDVTREALRMADIDKGMEIISLADIPAGTGLGFSGCYVTGLLNALYAWQGISKSSYDLAEDACRLEIDILRLPVGKQDQYMAAFGGLTVLEIERRGKIKVRKATVTEEVARDLNRNMLMFYTHSRRSASAILSEQNNRLEKDDVETIENMHSIKKIGYQILAAAESGNITDIGLLFDQHWQNKKKTAVKISNSHFDEIYEIGKAQGALGGKICGAGGGGFFLFYVENKHVEFTEKMEKLGLLPMKYVFNFEGSTVFRNSGNGSISKKSSFLDGDGVIKKKER